MQQQQMHCACSEQQKAYSPLTPPGNLHISCLLGKLNSALGGRPVTADVVPLVKQHPLNAGAQACGALPLCSKGSAVLSTEGAEHCHDDKGSQDGLDDIRQWPSPQV